MEKQFYENNDAIKSLWVKLIKEINFKMGSGCAFEQVLDSVFESLGLIVPFDRIGIALLDENRQSIRLAWVRSKIIVQSLKKDYSAAIVGSSLLNVIEAGRPRIINDLEEYLKEHPDSQSTRLILKDGIRSNLTCPLRAENRAVGVVFFSSRNPNTYNESHIDFLSSIADELSVIVEQAQLKNYFVEAKSKEKEFSKVLHDLKSPLSVIIGYLDLARSEDWYALLPSDIKDICSILNRNANSMMDLLNELSILKQKNKGEASQINIAEVQVSEFCKEVVASGRILGASKEISFEYMMGENLPGKVLMDRNRIRRVLDNLFTNAVKFSKRHTTIKFSVKSESGRLYFSVLDQGQGIMEQDLPKLFTEFGTTSTLPTEGERSTGLGLSIAKAIVKQHGGEISVRTKFGEGSEFTFWIPISSA